MVVNDAVLLEYLCEKGHLQFLQETRMTAMVKEQLESEKFQHTEM